MQKEKQFLLDELESLIAGGCGYILAQYSGLLANEAYEMRQRLRKVNGEWESVRKRVFVKAAEKAGRPIEVDLPGSIGVVVVRGDFSEASKELCAIIKGVQDRVTILGGWAEGRPCSAQGVQKMASLPSKDEMRSQLLATFQAPMTATVTIMDALLASVPQCLRQKVEQQS